MNLLESKLILKKIYEDVVEINFFEEGLNTLLDTIKYSSNDKDYIEKECNFNTFIQANNYNYYNYEDINTKIYTK